MKIAINNMFVKAHEHLKTLQSIQPQTEPEGTNGDCFAKELSELKLLLEWLERRVRNSFQALHTGLSLDDTYELTVMAEAMQRQGVRLRGRELWLAAKYYHHQYRNDWDWCGLPFEDEMNLPEDQFVPTVEDNIDLYVETNVIDDFE